MVRIGDPLKGGWMLPRAEHAKSIANTRNDPIYLFAIVLYLCNPSPCFLLAIFWFSLAGPSLNYFFSSPQDFGVAEANVLVWVNQGSRFLVILFIFSECRSAVCDLVWVICLASHFSGPKIKTHIFRNGTVWSRCLLCFANV